MNNKIENTALKAALKASILMSVTPGILLAIYATFNQAQIPTCLALLFTLFFGHARGSYTTLKSLNAAKQGDKPC